MLSSAAQFLSIIGLLVAGELLDKFNERYIVGIGAIGVSVALLLGAIADNYISLLVCLLIVGGFYSSAQPGGAKSVSSWFATIAAWICNGNKAGRTTIRWGGALAGIVLPASALVYGIQGAFLVDAIVSFLGGCIFIIFYHSPAKVVAIVPESRARASFYANVRSRLAMLAAPHMKNIIFSGVSLVIVQYVLIIFITIYFYRIYHLSLDKSAYLFFVSQAAGALGRIILATWSDHCRKGRFFPVLFCMIAVVFGFLILILGISGSIIYLTILSA
ncbi:sugar phosphate permease [Bartonella silvatica]|uniref:Sugar phosphate permease n=1 Tax=Bartonella silvatica TaxID=357760 RepID=A0ABV2HG49_9HYPH